MRPPNRNWSSTGDFPYDDPPLGITGQQPGIESEEMHDIDLGRVASENIEWLKRSGTITGHAWCRMVSVWLVAGGESGAGIKGYQSILVHEFVRTIGTKRKKRKKKKEDERAALCLALR